MTNHGRGDGLDALTSENNPIRVIWVDLAQVAGIAEAPGRLGMTFLPGKHSVGLQGQVHQRDLEADVARLRETWAVDALLLLVEDHELVVTGTERIAEVMAANGIELMRFPVRDTDLPRDTVTYARQLDEITRRVRAGQSVVVACLGGHGRTGTAVGCILRDAGADPDAAVRLTRERRAGAIEPGRQERFVREWGIGS